jgi:3-oxoacyl-[acyl-carrier protein] reductase
MKFVTLITGAGRTGGVGAAIARQVAARGPGQCIALNYLTSKDQAAEVAKQCTDLGAETLLVPGDIRLATDRANIVGSTLSRFSKIDLLVNNAGKPAPVNSKTDDTEVYADLTITNAVAPFLLSELVAERMQHQGNGSIIFISSVAAKGGGSSAAYGMSKAAVDYAIATLSKRFAGKIHVSGIAPGVVDTQWWDGRFANDIKKREFLEGAAKGPVGLVSAEDVAAVLGDLLYGASTGSVKSGEIRGVRPGAAGLGKFQTVQDVVKKPKPAL